MPKTRKPQQERSRQTVAAIVEAGLLCIQQHGVEGTTTRKIADAAGIGVGSLYEYFSNKDDVFAAIHEHVVNEIVGVVKPLIPELVKQSPEDATRALLISSPLVAAGAAAAGVAAAARATQPPALITRLRQLRVK